MTLSCIIEVYIGVQQSVLSGLQNARQHPTRSYFEAFHVLIYRVENSRMIFAGIIAGSISRSRASMHSARHDLPSRDCQARNYTEHDGYTIIPLSQGLPLSVLSVCMSPETDIISNFHLPRRRSAHTRLFKFDHSYPARGNHRRGIDFAQPLIILSITSRRTGLSFSRDGLKLRYACAINSSRRGDALLRVGSGPYPSRVYSFEKQIAVARETIDVTIYRPSRAPSSPWGPPPRRRRDNVNGAEDVGAKPAGEIVTVYISRILKNHGPLARPAKLIRSDRMNGALMSVRFTTISRFFFVSLEDCQAGISG